LSGFQLSTGDLDLDLGSGHTASVVHHSPSSIYISNFIEIGKTFCGRTIRRDPSKLKVTWHKKVE